MIEIKGKLKYELQIGEFVSYPDGEVKPKTTIPITVRELELLKRFSHTEVQEDLSIIYILNNIRFKVGIYIPQLENDN